MTPVLRLRRSHITKGWKEPVTTGACLRQKQCRLPVHLPSCHVYLSISRRATSTCPSPVVPCLPVHLPSCRVYLSISHRAVSTCPYPVVPCLPVHLPSCHVYLSISHRAKSTCQSASCRVYLSISHHVKSTCPSPIVPRLLCLEQERGGGRAARGAWNCEHVGKPRALSQSGPGSHSLANEKGIVWPRDLPCSSQSHRTRFWVFRAGLPKGSRWLRSPFLPQQEGGPSRPLGPGLAPSLMQQQPLQRCRGQVQAHPWETSASGRCCFPPGGPECGTPPWDPAPTPGGAQANIHWQPRGEPP
ncbi:PREDICTED: uncharacterized protein LOC106726487 [Myotis brandtii]|uniref:uncharacterized protein LOC106726487 n=1 Tax=Myotis brandtii TaxID=109478 RepID=UPI0007040B75|nr:PREDICTED: uncharacterized protein LOC106726487 [Myotis brandtii]